MFLLHLGQMLLRVAAMAISISWSGIAATKEKANRKGAERAEKTQRFGTRKNTGGLHELLLPSKGAPLRGEVFA